MSASHDDDSKDSASFADLGLPPTLLRSIEEAGFEIPLPVQARAIPPALAGRDVVISAETGSGKTLAYLAPAGARLLAGSGRLLVLVPTRELAAQVAQVASAVLAPVGLQPALLHGGVKLGGQARALREGARVLVATPGRLRDHLRRGNLSPEDVAVLVIDEADRMLAPDFADDVRRIQALIPPDAQTLLLSATVDELVEGLAEGRLRDPVRVRAELREAQVIPPGIRHEATIVRQPLKRLLLPHVLAGSEVAAALVFTATRFRCEILARLLVEEEVRAEALHARRTQTQRDAAMAALRAGEIDVLVATDLAERGLDLPRLTHVINFDLPATAATYAHRVGRTARAFGEGTALTFVTPPEESEFEQMLEHLGLAATQREIEGFDYATKPRGLDPLIPRQQRRRSGPRDERDEPRPKRKSPVQQRKSFWERARKARDEREERRGGPPPRPRKRKP